ncbi:MAG TPA: hypothetical protein VJN18_32735 [Polyangiaceae bacterium]|nr:hypothetical protein [Polyangiaceae bacterium]
MPNPLELRKILLVGYQLDAPLGAPMLHGDGTPMGLRECPVRMRIAFWVPQAQPYRRREIGTLADFLHHLASRRPQAAATVLASPAAPLDGNQGTLIAYMQRHQIDLMQLADAPHAFTLVADPRPFELEALRDGAIVEQVQDFTFPRWPSLEEQRRLLMPHWEQRTLASLGYLPHRAPEDHQPKPTIIYESV